MKRPSPRSLALLAAAVVALVAVGAWALLDDDGGGAARDGAGAPVEDLGPSRSLDDAPDRDPSDDEEAPPPSQPARSADERAAVAAVLRHFRAIRAGDGEAACDELSPAGRRRLVADLRAVGASSECEEGVLELQVPELRVRGVRIEDDRGVVALAEGLEYEVERVDGDWKLAG